MNNRASVAAAYDLVAEEYAAKFYNEFDHKPFDRMLLTRYAAEVPADQTVLEIGCGPGEVSGFLHKLGVRCLGTDISPKMLENARKYFPEVSFEVQDFFHLTFADQSFCAVVAFYAIVNFPVTELSALFREVVRVLKPGGSFLFAFHIYDGTEQITVETFLDHPIEPLTFYLFPVDQVKQLVESAGLRVIDLMLRYPYPEVEYGSKRAYFLVAKP